MRQRDGRSCVGGYSEHRPIYYRAITTLLKIGVSAFGFLLSALVYLYDLDRSPVYLGLDEAHFAVHAQAIAETGRNLNGDFLPLFVSLADPLGDQPQLAWGESWYHPLLFYLIALALKVLPLSEASVRVPSALIAGTLNVALMYAIAMRLFRTHWIAIGAATMLALTPAHLVLGRQIDYLSPLPFQLASLWCLLAFRDTERIGFAFAGGLILGIGCYSYVSSWMLMPALFAFSWLIYRRSRIGARRPLAAAATGFAMPLLMLAPWLWSHPQMLDNLLASQSMSVVDTFGRGLPMAQVLQRTLTTYWSYFNPAFLFLTGGPSLSTATGQAGVFLLPVVVLLPVGLAMMFRAPQLGGMQWVLLLGLLVSPIPATLKGMPHVVQRTTTLLPFAVLIATCGAWALWHSSSRLARALLVLLLVALPIQFAFFYADYLTGYRLRSASAYDRTAFVETARVLLDVESAGGVPAIYLTAPLYDVSAKWRFYATKAHRADVLHRTRYFNGDLTAIGDAPSGSLVVVEPDNPRIDPAVSTGGWSIERRVTDLTGRPTLTVLRKKGG
ncbi:MAG: ArnT family glycosyltransferase [Vicinamibacterales bacterium]